MVSVNVRLAVGDLERFTEGAIKQLVFESHANITETTPIDTGWARANLVPEIGQAHQGTAGTRADAERGSIDLGTSQLGLAKVAAAYRLFMGAVYLSHNVPYFPALNAGSSKQQAAGFVERGIAKAVTTVALRLNQS